MCVCNCNLTEHKALQLIKDYTTDHAQGMVKLCLDTNEEWSYSKLVECLRTLFESGKTFLSLPREFYGKYQKPKEMEDQFADGLQILARKVISVCPE